MPKPNAQPQAVTPEPRKEVVSLAVTEREKRAIVAVAAVWETDVSNLLRGSTIAQIVADFEDLKATKGAA